MTTSGYTQSIREFEVALKNGDRAAALQALEAMHPADRPIYEARLDAVLPRSE